MAAKLPLLDYEEEFCKHLTLMKNILPKIAGVTGLVALVFFTIPAPEHKLLGSIVYHGAESPGEGEKKIAALTFDDGPYGEPTEKVLDILKEKQVRATFFVVGKNAQKYPAILKREAAEGHRVGNHSFDHSKSLYKLSPAEFKKNTTEAEEAIFSIIGLRPRFFRPPFGLTSTDVIRALADMGYQVVMWSDMTNDWDASRTSEQVMERIIKRLRPGAIIVLHDGRDTQINYPRENMLKALPLIIDKIRQEGYELVTVDKLLGQDPYFANK